jgi:hypothetical protein
MSNERYDSHFVFFLWLAVCRGRETVSATVIYAMITLGIKKKWRNSLELPLAVASVTGGLEGSR